MLKDALSTIAAVQPDLLQPLGEGAEEELGRMLQAVRAGFVRGLAPDGYGFNEYGQTDT